MSTTIRLLKLIDLTPKSAASFSIRKNEISDLVHAAIRNRILFFFLHRIKTNNLVELTALHKKEQISYFKINDAIASVSMILSEANIEHAFFKTIRPYISTTVDLDILILGEYEDYAKSVDVIKNAGYKLVAHGPSSTTFLDEKANIGIDLYREVAVGFITYIDKRTLFPYVATSRLPNRKSVKTLKPEADLACVIAHSVIKEQMYTLSEYYTFIHYLKQMNINDFIQIVGKNNITSAARTHASLTALLHNTVHKTIPKELQEILETLGEERFETTKLIQKNFETPYKYHPITVARSLLELTKNKKARKSMAVQIYQMLDLNYTKKFLTDTLQHIKRETY